MSATYTLDVIDLVLRVASKSTGACESPPASNAGPYVERILKRCGLGKGYPWCAADVSDTGAIALGKHWPLPITASCVALGEFASKHHVLAETPMRGDVFLIWEHVQGVWRFGHTGFIIDVQQGLTCSTHEGNTSGGGSREGWLAADRIRTFGPKDRYIRWVDLLLSI